MYKKNFTCNLEYKSLIKTNDYWLLEYLEINPIIDAKKISEKNNIDYYKVIRIIIKFVDLEISKITDNSKKNICI